MLLFVAVVDAAVESDDNRARACSDGCISGLDGNYLWIHWGYIESFLCMAHLYCQFWAICIRGLIDFREIYDYAMHSVIRSLYILKYAKCI